MSVSQSVLVGDSVAVLTAALVACVHAVFGVGSTAPIIFRVIQELKTPSNLSNVDITDTNEPVDKTKSNLIVFISGLLSFQVVTSQLVYDLLYVVIGVDMDQVSESSLDLIATALKGTDIC